MLTTNDDEMAITLDRLRNHGASISEEQRHHGPKPYIIFYQLLRWLDTTIE